MQYGLAQAKARLSELTNLVDSGEEVVIAKHGRPSYRLISIDRQSLEKAASPSNLSDLAEFIARTRRLTRTPASTENFVANWRQNERY